ncbi:immunity protein Imm33 domain-containing protein [Clostridium sp. LP20]|uniref:immunity protein Imm33 domain-containing protein n=1 Tax=Clostridium sp. LP20 TaxID=3418665 RepID=UPI003EE58984
MCKDERSREGDSGWIFYEGTESEEYLKDTNNMGVYSLNTIANYDPDIILLLNSPEDKSFYRDRNGRFYEDN